MKEVVLNSGRFASMRPMTWWDRVITAGADTVELRILFLAARVTTLDGEPTTVEQLGNMELAEAQPIYDAVVQEFLAASKSKGVA